MDKEKLFHALDAREEDETCYDRIERLTRIRKAAAERTARRYANRKPKKEGRWVGGDTNPGRRSLSAVNPQRTQSSLISPPAGTGWLSVLRQTA